MKEFNNIYNMIDVTPTSCAILGIEEPSGSIGHVIEEITTDLSGYKKLCVLAMDAFGYYAYSLWNKKMPFLQSLHEKHSLIISSVMPTITPVNFSTMITGTTLKAHGGNSMSSILKCETIFEVLEKNNMTGSGIGLKDFTGSRILGRYSQMPVIYPDDSQDIEWDDGFYNSFLPLVEKSPDFIIAQLGTIDTVFHRFGPSSEKVVPMLQKTDEMLSKVVPMLNKKGYGVIILADHGQQDKVDVQGGTHGSAYWQSRLVPCTWI